MKSIDVVGGTYWEQCLEPSWNEHFGSGGRAACALSGVANVRFHTYLPDSIDPVSLKWARKINLVSRQTGGPDPVRFEYDHPLSTPRITPHPLTMKRLPPIEVTGDLVLRFGMLEGTAKVQAKRAVYDPQSAFEPEPFHENGSEAEILAYVINRYEAERMTGHSEVKDIAKQLFDSFGAAVAVIKCGAKGAFVCTPTDIQNIPSYKSNRVWKIGTGDIFSAAFAHYWGHEGLAPAQAANAASKVTSLYVETKSATVPPKDFLELQTFSKISPSQGRVYLAGPFFDLGQRWLIEEAYSVFQSFGVDVFSPLHDVGKGPAHEVAALDLQGLKNCDRVFAILTGLDTGTIYEVGYARALGIPVVILAQNVSAEDIKMPEGDGCVITDDFCTAIYQTVWI